MSTPLEKWVEKQAELTKPKRIYWCNGSEKEAREIVEIGMREEKINDEPIFTELNQKTWPNAYYHRSHPTDVARTEQLTFVCHPDKETAGPNNNWMHPDEAKKKLTALSDGCMKGKTMYVLPYMMGHPDSPYSKACVQITDVSYVAVSMRIMTRMGSDVIKKIGNSENFVKGLHSVGDFDPDKRFIMHFPDESFVWSIGSGYGGNALLGKKCFSLRLASCLGLKEGWLAEHMVIMGVEDPQGKITYIAAALPSACGKTNLAMLQSTLPGYKVWTIGDDIAWMNIGPDGQLWAINPETGYFGVAPGTALKTNPNMIETLKSGKFFPTLFTNTGIDLDKNEPWWEGLDGAVPENMIDWQGNKWTPESGTKAAHPNSRFTVSIYNSSTLSKEFDNPKGVPISAIIFGGKRSQLIPLVVESFNWQNGVFLGARMGSETTAAASHKEGQLRRDPMAMLPFCGYNMGDYFKHWLDVGKKLKNPPKIFSVNWFRCDENGSFIWPGFGDNIRVLKWIIDRVNNKVKAVSTPVGLVPDLDDLDTSGLSITRKNLEKLFEVKIADWKNELDDTGKFFKQFGKKFPPELENELAELVSAKNPSN
ncbi:MAG: phosphoenolpyruvate carboxykinase (GTP) [Elusimicrobiota bacterium]|nr:phosphoenolpyruvate carboxykinase (GTP) [Elusimicrobiota bacterium]